MMTAYDLMVGSITAGWIADAVYQRLRDVTAARGFRARRPHHERVAEVQYWLDKEEFVLAGRCARGLDPFLAASDPDTEYFKQLVEAARYMRWLRTDARRLKAAAFAIANDPLEIAAAALGADWTECQKTALQSIADIGLQS